MRAFNSDYGFIVYIGRYQPMSITKPRITFDYIFLQHVLSNVHIVELYQLS